MTFNWPQWEISDFHYKKNIMTIFIFPYSCINACLNIIMLYLFVCSNISVISRRTPIQTTPTPSYDSKPGKSILKKTPSTSTYGTNRGSVFGEGDSGVGNNNSFGQNQSYEHGSTNSDTSAGKYEVYRIETLPDPNQARRGKNGSLPQGSHNLSGSGVMGSGALAGAGYLHSSTDSESQAVPTPVRNTKKRRGQSPSVASSSGRQNPSYSPDTSEITTTATTTTKHPPDGSSSGGRTMQHYSNDGYDMYEGDTKSATVQSPAKMNEPRANINTSNAQPVSMYDGDTTGGSTVPQPVRKKRTDPDRRQRRAQQQADTSGSQATYSEAYAGTGAIRGVGAYDSSFQNQAFNPQEADLGYPGVHETIPTTTTKHGSRSMRPVHDTSANRLNTSTASADSLRINIKAQPGTAVHITPTGTHAHNMQRTAPTASQSSVETEI